MSSRKFVVLAAGFALAGCKARQDAATLRDDGAGASAGAAHACATGFEPSCTAAQITNILLGTLTEAEVARIKVAEQAGVTTHEAPPGAQTTAAELLDAESDLNEIRSRVATLRTEVTGLAPAASVDIQALVLLVERATALKAQLERAQRDAGANPDETVRAQITVLDRNIQQLITRVNAAKAAATTAQSSNLVLWVNAYTSVGTVEGWLKQEAGVTGVQNGGRIYHWVAFTVTNGKKADLLRRYKDYYDASYDTAAFNASKVNEYFTFRLPNKGGEGCHNATVWLAVNALTLTLNRYGKQSDNVPNAERVSYMYEISSDRMSVWAKNPPVNVPGDFKGYLPDYAKKCLVDHDWGVE